MMERIQTEKFPKEGESVVQFFWTPAGGLWDVRTYSSNATARLGLKRVIYNLLVEREDAKQFAEGEDDVSFWKAEAERIHQLAHDLRTTVIRRSEVFRWLQSLEEEA